MTDFSVRALLLEQRFDDAEALLAEASKSDSNSLPIQRAHLLLETLNGSDVLASYLEFLGGRTPSFEDRALFSYIARHQLERVLQNSESINARCQAAELLGALRDGGAVGALSRALSNRDVSPGSLLVRRVAADALAQIGGPAVRPLAEEFIRDEDPSIRRSLLLCLGSDPQPHDVTNLLEALQLGGPGERAAVAHVLASPKYPNAPALLRSLLVDATETVRLTAARSLASLGETEADTEFFCQTLISEHDPRAARLLGLLAGSNAVHSLLEVLHVAEEETSIAAAIALGELGERIALYPLLELARSERTLLSVVAIEAIATLGDPSAVSLLVPLLAQGDRRIAVVKALGILGGVGVLPILLDLLVMAKEQREDWRFIKELLLALGNLGESAAVPSLLAVLQGYDERLKGSAAEALGRIGDLSATEPLLLALRSSNAELRIKSSKALGALCDPSSVPALLGLLDHSQLEFRAVAAYPLGVMAWADLP